MSSVGPRPSHPAPGRGTVASDAAAVTGVPADVPPARLADLPDALLAACLRHLDPASLVAARRSGRALAAAALDVPALRACLSGAGVGAAHLPPPGAPAATQRALLWDRLRRHVGLQESLRAGPLYLATCSRWCGAALAADGQSYLVFGRLNAWWLHLGPEPGAASGPLRRAAPPAYPAGPLALGAVKASPGGRFVLLSWLHGAHQVRDLHHGGRLCGEYADVDALHFAGTSGAMVGRDAATHSVFVVRPPRDGGGPPAPREPVFLPAAAAPVADATGDPGGTLVGLLHSDRSATLLARDAGGVWWAVRHWALCAALQFSSVSRTLLVAGYNTPELFVLTAILTPLVTLYRLEEANAPPCWQASGTLRAFCRRTETLLYAPAVPPGAAPTTLVLSAAAPHEARPLAPALRAAVAGCALGFTDSGSHLVAWRPPPPLPPTALPWHRRFGPRGPHLRLFDARHLAAVDGAADAAAPPPWRLVGDAAALPNEDDCLSLAADGRRAIAWNERTGPARLYALAPADEAEGAAGTAPP